MSDKSQAYDDGDWNNWHDNTTKEGNYWSNWDGQGWGTPNAYQIDGGKASDWYPLGSPVGEEHTIILPITLISIFVAGSFATRKAFKIFQKTFLP
ncbi:MAG: hypothetical protein QXJ27_02750 [Thermoplasmata archaeon]